MDENLVGYLLDCLDDAGKRQVEGYLQASPEARQKLARLKQALAPLAADRDEIVPPPGLAGRTLAKIGAETGSDLPRAPRQPTGPAPVSRAWWRRMDVLVVTVLVALAAGALTPLIYRWHERQALIACQNNLRQFYAALTTYRDQQDAYPDLTREAPRDVAGMIVPMLADAGVLPQSFTVRCPGVGPHLGCSVTLANLRTLPESEFLAEAPNLAQCYAFTLGYRDAAGTYHAPWQMPASSCPIFADRPPSGGVPGNSMNHGGVGQNVLFLDGHTSFVTQRTVGDPNDDIFLNRDNLVAAGTDQRDIVLGPSAVRP
jgi:prepilin-type processing-associated H-X9-DG protein